MLRDLVRKKVVAVYCWKIY